MCLWKTRFTQNRWLHTSLPLTALLICFFLLPSDLAAQKAKNLKTTVKTVKKPTKNKSVNSRVTPAMLLNGSKQLGARFVYGLNGGIGGEADFGYLFKNKFIAEAAAGFYYETHGDANDVIISRIPIHLGVKYRLIEISKNAAIYSGAGLKILLQSQTNITSDRELSKTAFGPTVYGEGVFNLKPQIALVIRGDQIFIPGEKFVNEDGNSEAVKVFNISLGLRKTF